MLYSLRTLEDCIEHLIWDAVVCIELGAVFVASERADIGARGMRGGWLESCELGDLYGIVKTKN